SDRIGFLAPWLGNREESNPFCCMVTRRSGLFKRGCKAVVEQNVAKWSAVVSRVPVWDISGSGGLWKAMGTTDELVERRSIMSIAVQEILKRIEELSDEDRLVLQSRLAELAESEWRHEVELARQKARESGLTQEQVDKAVEQVRYGS